MGVYVFVNCVLVIYKKKRKEIIIIECGLNLDYV